MKQTTKNKIEILIWILLLGFNFLYIANKSIEVWEKGVIMIGWIVIALLNLNRMNKRYKDLTLIDDILITIDTFSNEKQYNLKTVLGWTEIHYQTMGFKTGREIILRTASGEKVNFFDSNSEGFEKLSDYLNENLPSSYEN